MNNRAAHVCAGILAIAGLLAGCGQGQSLAAQSVSKKTDGAVVGGTIRVTAEELSRIAAGAPENVRTRILKSPARFLELMVKVLNEPEDLTVLVDKQHALPADYAPSDLVALRNYYLTLNKEDLELRKAVVPDLLAMVHAARLDHVVLALSSTYRSYAYQEKIFAMNVRQLGLKEAERESAHPGTSQHQLGTTIDFGSITPAFAHTAAGRWLAKNGWKYGFTMSYPEGYEKLTGYMYEPWHFRYIGIPAARAEHDYFDSIQQELLVFLHTHGPELRKILHVDKITHDSH